MHDGVIRLLIGESIELTYRIPVFAAGSSCLESSERKQASAKSLLGRGFIERRERTKLNEAGSATQMDAMNLLF